MSSNNGTSVRITIPDQEREASTADVSTVKKEVDQLPSNERQTVKANKQMLQNLKEFEFPHFKNYYVGKSANLK